MNDDDDECVFIYRTYHIVSQSGLQFYLSEIGRQLVKAPLAAAISPYLISLTHPNMKCTMNQWNYRETTTPGTTSPILLDKSVGSLTSPADHVTLKMQETGPTVYSPYPRRLECLTICSYIPANALNVPLCPLIFSWQNSNNFILSSQFKNAYKKIEKMYKSKCTETIVKIIY